jgi:hypothetical protein
VLPPVWPITSADATDEKQSADNTAATTHIVFLITLSVPVQGLTAPARDDLCPNPSSATTALSFSPKVNLCA